MMRMLVFLVCVVVALANADRTKREAYDLPDGVALLISAVKTTFVCSNDGYYADVDNNCQIFHVCLTDKYPDGKEKLKHWSFICGNQTVFNQLTFTCALPEESVICNKAPDFFYLNNQLGQEKAPFLVDDDIKRAEPFIPGRSSKSLPQLPLGGGGKRRG
ncbi:uncharacterized protein LOC143234970 [Tachypleus tridentatus]|uniref:uncharacterized protein LOC143234970 n=1 Tax=Tachypleus tridentatus TaxID=6853 RepID=UPI003FD4AE92